MKIYVFNEAELAILTKQIVKQTVEELQTVDDSPKFLTRKQASELLKCSLVTIDRHVKRGKLTKYKMGGTTYFSESEILNRLSL
jgi:excisionase family DNA binding protein